MFKVNKPAIFSYPVVSCKMEEFGLYTEIKS